MRSLGLIKKKMRRLHRGKGAVLLNFVGVLLYFNGKFFDCSFIVSTLAPFNVRVVTDRF